MIKFFSEGKLLHAFNPVGRYEAQAIRTIRERYGASVSALEQLPFHCAEHTKTVIFGTRSILAVIHRTSPFLVSDKDIQLGRIAAASHDTVQEWKEVNGFRKSITGSNEAKSAEEALAFMDAENRRHRVPLFTEADKEKVREAIMGTVPTYDEQTGTALQKNLTPRSSLIARAVALADLNIFALKPHYAVPNSHQLFREWNIDVLRAIMNGNISQDTTLEYRERMLSWLSQQVTFTRGRKEQFELELSFFPLDARLEIKTLFSRFPAAIESLKDEIAHCPALSFEALVRRFGY